MWGVILAMIFFMAIAYAEGDPPNWLEEEIQSVEESRQ